MVIGSLSFSIEEPSKSWIGKLCSPCHQQFVSNGSHSWQGNSERTMSATTAASLKGLNLNGVAVARLVSSVERDTGFTCYRAKVVTCWPAKTAAATDYD